MSEDRRGWNWRMPWYDGPWGLQDRTDWDNCRVLAIGGYESDSVEEISTSLDESLEDRVRVGEWRRVPNFDSGRLQGWACELQPLSESVGTEP